MTIRRQLGAAQLGVFVCGGVLAPIAHLGGHRPDHGHGPQGRVIISEVETRGRADHLHPHAHGHHDDHQHPHGRGEGAARPAAAAEPLDTTHGHGSIAHFGLALLSAAPAPTLPAPSSGGLLPRRAHPRAAALFEPSFPLPRPPPPAALS